MNRDQLSITISITTINVMYSIAPIPNGRVSFEFLQVFITAIKTKCSIGPFGNCRRLKKGLERGSKLCRRLEVEVQIRKARTARTLKL